MPGFGRSLDDQDPEPRREPHAHVRQLAAERAPLRLDARRRRTGERQSRRGLRGTGRPAGRDAATRAMSAFRKSPPAGCTARWAIRRRSCSATTSTSSSTTTSRSTAARTASSLAPTTFICSCAPEQPDNARGAFTYTGQFSGNALADFLLGYPTSATSGIGRGDEDGRTNWLHLYAQDDWRVRDNLTVQRRPSLRIQPAHGRREQSAFIHRLVCPRRPIRDRQRRQRQHQP